MALLMLKCMRTLPPLILAAIVALLTTTTLKAQTLKFADESFTLSGKEADVEKIENDYLPNGERPKRIGRKSWS